MGALAGKPLGVVLTDRFGGRRPPRGALASFAPALAIFPLTTGTVAGTAVWMVVVGVAGWTTNAPVQRRLIEIAPDSSALLLALNASAVYLGGRLSVWSAGC